MSFIEFSAQLEPTGDPMFVKASRPTKATLLAMAVPTDKEMEA